MTFFKSTIDDNRTQYSLIPLLECKDAVQYTILSFSVITVDIRRVRYQALLDDGSAIVVDGFMRDTEELNRRVFSTRIAVQQSCSHACLVQVKKRVLFSYSCVYVSLLLPLHALGQ